MPRLLALLFICLLALPALAQSGPDCQGRDLLAALTPTKKAALIGEAPFANGNFWQARKGKTTITIAGSYRLNDPRFDPLMPKLAPYLDAAAALLVEAGPKQQAALKADMVAHPEHLIITSGPTLPEALSAADWHKLTVALTPQGIPTVVAAKLQPWYVAILLGMPICKPTPDLLNGLDNRLITLAEARRIPIEALEPWDTAIKFFETMSPAEQMKMLHLQLAQADSPTDLAITLANAYFAGAHQLLWAWGRQQALDAPGGTLAERRAEFDRMARALLTDRTRSWIAPLLAAADGKTVFLAVGAAHLGGRDGLLSLLQAEGFRISPLDL